MARIKKEPTLNDIEAQIRALQAQRDERKRALDAEERQRRIAAAEKRKGDIRLVADKIAAASIKRGIAELVYDQKLSMADVEAALVTLAASATSASTAPAMPMAPEAPEPAAPEAPALLADPIPDAPQEAGWPDQA